MCSSDLSDVGLGTVDWKTIIAALRKIGALKDAPVAEAPAKKKRTRARATAEPLPTGPRGVLWPRN